MLIEIREFREFKEFKEYREPVIYIRAILYHRVPPP